MSEREIAQRLRSEYVKDDCVQVMLPFQGYLQLWGNGGLMFYQYLLKDIQFDRRETAIINFDGMNRFVNTYPLDERNFGFPYAGIPQHTERVGLFKKTNLVNQILDFEKPYVAIFDGYVVKYVAYKDGDSAILHVELLNNIRTVESKTKLSRESLEKYLRTGTAVFDPTQYKSIQICDTKGGLYHITLQSEEYYQNLTREEMQHSLNPYPYTERTTGMLKKMIENLDESLPYIVLANKRMIKFTEDSEISLENFAVVRTGNDEYETWHAKVPLKVDSIDNIKGRLGSEIKTMREPKIKNKMILRKRELQL
jgi:hypothetical protein